MERFKQQLDQIQQQMAGLSASQKLLVVCLVAIMGVTLVWWTSAAAQREMVNLLDQSLTDEQIGPMRNQLSRAGIPFEVSGSQIMVPSARRGEAIAMLSYEKALPSDTAKHFEKTVSGISSFDPAKKIDAAILVATQNELAQIIRNYPNVRSATVIVNPNYKRRVGGDLMPTASINIMTDRAGDARKIATSATYAVASSFTALKAENVTVVVDGDHIDSGAGDSTLAGGSEYLELRAKAERDYEQKIRGLFRHIPGLQVAVSAEVDNSTRRSIERTVDPDNKIAQPVMESITTMDSSNTTQSGEAGLVSNTGFSVAGSAGSGQEKTEEQSTTETSFDYGRKDTESFTRAGTTTPVGCTVNVPNSFFVTEWQSFFNSTTAPDAQQLTQYRTTKMAELKESISKVLANLTTDAIMIDTYADTLPGGEPLPASLGGLAMAGTDDAGGFSAIVRDYGKTAAVLALAGVALFLMATMVKKTAPATIANVPSFEGSLPGFELGEIDIDVDEDVLAGTKTVEQVQALVKENPDAAASLVKRWINDAA